MALMKSPTEKPNAGVIVVWKDKEYTGEEMHDATVYLAFSRCLGS